MHFPFFSKQTFSGITSGQSSLKADIEMEPLPKVPPHAPSPDTGIDVIHQTSMPADAAIGALGEGGVPQKPRTISTDADAANDHLPPPHASVDPESEPPIENDIPMKNPPPGEPVASPHHPSPSANNNVDMAPDMDPRLSQRETAESPPELRTPSTPAMPEELHPDAIPSLLPLPHSPGVVNVDPLSHISETPDTGTSVNHNEPQVNPAEADCSMDVDPNAPSGPNTSPSSETPHRQDDATAAYPPKRKRSRTETGSNTKAEAQAQTEVSLWRASMRASAC